MLAYAFETWQVLRVCFHTDARNQRSRAALERIGGKFEGTLRAHRMAADIKAGSVWINTYNGFDTASPFGGYKQSGFGRDLGSYALEQYTNIKSVWVAL